MHVRNLLIAASLCMPTIGMAADAPQFLTGKKFATSKGACKAIGEGDELQIDQHGIYGNEFSCRFLDFVGEIDIESGESFVYVSRANCGDDSGIYRPDLLTLIPQPDGSQITVQSQNEYVLTEAETRTALLIDKFDPNNPPSANYVSNDYKLCK